MGFESLFQSDDRAGSAPLDAHPGSGSSGLPVWLPGHGAPPVPTPARSAEASATTLPTAQVPDTGSLSATPGAPDKTPQAIGHIVVIVVIVGEKPSRPSILGNRDAPYINKLATGNALATNYRAVAHPSLPDYLSMTGGTTAGITTDCTPGDGCLAGVPNITESLERSGRTWKMYAEGMPAPFTATDSGTYAVRHNSFMYCPGITADASSCREHVVPLTRLDEDLQTAAGLPDLVFVAPNLCNDMHDCPVAIGGYLALPPGTRHTCVARIHDPELPAGAHLGRGRGRRREQHRADDPCRPCRRARCRIPPAVRPLLPVADP